MPRVKGIAAALFAALAGAAVVAQAAKHGEPPAGSSATALVEQSQALTRSGRWDDAAAMLNGNIASARRTGDRKAEAALAVELGRVLLDRNAYHRRNPSAALAALDTALAVARESGEPQSEADAIQYLGQFHYGDAFATNDWETPRSFFLQALRKRERLGDRRGLAESYFYLGLTFEQEGRPEPAMDCYEKSLALSEEIGDRALQSYAHRHIGGIEEERGELEAAEGDISCSLELRRAAGFSVLVPFALLQKADFVAGHRGDDEEAARLLGEAIDVAEASRSTRALAAARIELARVYLKGNDARRALSYARCARESARRFGDPEELKSIEEQLAEIQRRLAS